MYRWRRSVSLRVGMLKNIHVLVDLMIMKKNGYVTCQDQDSGVLNKPYSPNDNANQFEYVFLSATTLAHCS